MPNGLPQLPDRRWVRRVTRDEASERKEGGEVGEEERKEVVEMGKEEKREGG